jgi:hypothetical protein
MIRQVSIRKKKSAQPVFPLSTLLSFSSDFLAHKLRDLFRFAKVSKMLSRQSHRTQADACMRAWYTPMLTKQS